MRKQCSKCKKSKQIAEFYRNRSKTDGLNGWCKPCQDKLTKKYIKEHAQETKQRHKKYGEEHAEEVSICHHFHAIFNPKNVGHRFYKGMPFFDGWNPKKNGSYRVGGEWIRKNIGKRPKGCTLHVVDHEKGFVPGNLEWAHPRKQVHQQMFKIIAQLKNENKILKEEISKLRGEN